MAVERRHRETAARTMFPGLVELSPLWRWVETGEGDGGPTARVAEALAKAEADAVAPFVAFMLWERDNYRSVVVENTGPDEVLLSWSDENDGGGMVSGKTPREAAVALCRKLGIGDQ